MPCGISCLSIEIRICVGNMFRIADVRFLAEASQARCLRKNYGHKMVFHNTNVYPGNVFNIILFFRMMLLLLLRLLLLLKCLSRNVFVYDVCSTMLLD